MAVKKLIVFGTKHPQPTQLGTAQIFDVQILNNPKGTFIYPLTGLHDAVYAQIIKDPNFMNLVGHAANIIALASGPEFGIRCNGGRHRSPAFAWYIAGLLGIV